MKRRVLKDGERADEAKGTMKDLDLTRSIAVGPSCACGAGNTPTRGCTHVCMYKDQERTSFHTDRTYIKHTYTHLYLSIYRAGKLPM